MKKLHATDDVDPVERTLCGRRIVLVMSSRPQVWLTAGGRDVHIDNANPDCGRCLRAIAARIKKEN